VVPFPIARAGSSFVAYEDYLFELRHYIHYYQTQQKLDFTTEAGKQQLADYQKRALNNVINNAYVKQLATKNKVSVSDQEVENELAILRTQNRLGASDKGFEDVLKENFGWSLSDFKRSLKQQMLAQKVVTKLDTATQGRAQAALKELQGGADFAAVAKKYSDDISTKANGGDLGGLVDKSTRDLAPQTTAALFQLKARQVSGIVNNGFGLEIIKAIEVQGDKVHAAHITFNFKGIGVYINELKAKNKPHAYIKL
jgi:parvulin-like peptidyl-prolyl isomerase